MNLYLASKLGSSFILSLALWLPAAATNAADFKSCSIVGPTVVEGAISEHADVYSLPGAPAGMDACAVSTENDDDYTIVRDSGVFAYGAPVAPGALVQLFFPQVTDDTLAQINATNQSGTDVTAPGFDFTTVSGLGDGAVVVHTVPATMVTIVVWRGTDAYLFQTDDLGAGQAHLTALAQAIVPNGSSSVAVAGATVSGTDSQPAGGPGEAR